MSDLSDLILDMITRYGWWSGPIIGVLALDARIKIAKPKLSGGARLAIHPYPKQLEEYGRDNSGPNFLVNSSEAP